MHHERSLRFVDLFAGLGGFHLALKRLGHVCVLASEIDEELRRTYLLNFPDMAGKTVGDISRHWKEVPPHDILCAGFPCQPFSKSGYQGGEFDTRGTLFDEILKILKIHKPEYVMLENVGNFEQHDGGRTWSVAKRALGRLGYSVVATEHVKSGGRGLLSPHHFGFPQNRERFYAVCRRGPLAQDVLPLPSRDVTTVLEPFLQANEGLTDEERQDTRLTDRQVVCVEMWNEFLKAMPSDVQPPWFPLWTDEFEATYPYIDRTPFMCTKAELLRFTRKLGGHERMTKAELVGLLPSYAAETVRRFPSWKIAFIWRNRDWYKANKPWLPEDWLKRLRLLPPSYRKFEWNCKGARKDLWLHVLQFRPSGLRVKRLSSIPALVSLTTTQVPIIGPRRRFITCKEGLRLQGFPEDHRLPLSRAAAFQALGNAIHVDVVATIASRVLGQPSVSASAALPVPNANWSEVDVAVALG